MRTFWVKEKAYGSLHKALAQKYSPISYSHNKSGLYRLIDIAIALFKECDFAKTPSVDNRKVYKSASLNEYQVLRECSLLEHIINTIEFVEKEAPEEEREVLILYGLLHDIGKSHKLREKYGVSNERGHEFASGEIIEHLVDEYEEFARFKSVLIPIAQELKGGKKRYFSKLFAQIDAKARRKEKRK